jgi:hypothetical protein
MWKRQSQTVRLAQLLVSSAGRRFGLAAYCAEVGHPEAR